MRLAAPVCSQMMFNVQQMRAACMQQRVRCAMNASRLTRLNNLPIQVGAAAAVGKPPGCGAAACLRQCSAVCACAQRVLLPPPPPCTLATPRSEGVRPRVCARCCGTRVRARP